MTPCVECGDQDGPYTYDGQPYCLDCLPTHPTNQEPQMNTYQDDDLTEGQAELAALLDEDAAQVEFEDLPGQSTLVKQGGTTMGMIKGKGPRSMHYRVTILFPRFVERDNVFGYQAAKDLAVELLGAQR